MKKKKDDRWNKSRKKHRGGLDNEEVPWSNRQPIGVFREGQQSSNINSPSDWRGTTKYEMIAFR